MTIQITRLRPDTITGEGYDWGRMGYVEDDGDVILKENDNRTKAGTVDRSGYIYDDHHRRVGSVDSEGRVYDAEQNRIAHVETWGNWAGMVIDRKGNRVTHAEPWGHDRCGFGWLAKAAGAGYLLLVRTEPARHAKWLKDMGFR